MLKTNYYNYLFTDYIGVGASKGEIGIEVEVEGRGLPPAVTGWNVVPDGSLRGESAEYVLRQPVPRDKYEDTLNNLRDALSSATINNSYRTSVHVHINAKDMYVRHIYNQMLIYLLFENALSPIYGKERVGNLFCLRMRDAQQYLDTFRWVVANDRLNEMNNREMRYLGLNPVSLFAHGSLEYRHMRGTTDTDEIKAWVSMLLRMKDTARQFDYPSTLMDYVRKVGPDFARDIFSGDEIGRFDPDWLKTFDEGVEMANHIAYACKWEDAESFKERMNNNKGKKSKVDPYVRYMTNANVLDAWRPEPALALRPNPDDIDDGIFDDEEN